ncbi:hypothetical protein Ndes2526B_g02371 [Nannochloris sp. 'desiccata']|nr:hypothetical protein NADE_007937 [Chlorella desiccata (nom. nud.)]
MATSAMTGLYSPKVQSSPSHCVVNTHPAFSPILASQRAGNHINYTPTLKVTRSGTVLTAKRPRLHAELTNHQSLPEAARRTLHLIPHSLVPSTSSYSSSDENITSKDENNSSSSRESSNTEAKIDLNLPRRSRLIAFTCNLCDGRSERLVNPVAWDKGLVIVQCQHCKKWHKVADAANLVEEIRYADLEE